jgi:methylthioribose-1-phosphate isomerase
MGDHGAALVPAGARILTHCNAGALATAGYGTALGVVRSAHAQGKVALVWVDETRPVLQGSRLTAWECVRDGIPHRLIADDAAAAVMARGQVDLVVTGADRIAANGDTANKIGTYALAVLARHHGVPFYVAAPFSTIDPALASGREIPIEERDAAEVRGFGLRQTAPAASPVYNPAFDVTPAELISAIVTERGVFRPPYRF